MPAKRYRTEEREITAGAHRNWPEAVSFDSILARMLTAQSVIFVNQSIALTRQTNPRDLLKAVPRIRD